MAVLLQKPRIRNWAILLTFTLFAVLYSWPAVPRLV